MPISAVSASASCPALCASDTCTTPAARPAASVTKTRWSRPHRELLAEVGHGGRLRHAAGVAAHQPGDSQVADAADILSTADRLAAQMEAPGGEGIIHAHTRPVWFHKTDGTP